MMIYKNFIFEKYELDKPKNEIRFYFSLDGKINFVEKIKLTEKVNWKNVNSELLESVLFSLHLALGISYYKAYCPRKIVIESGRLNKAMANFWNNLYTQGLGEFFYKNKIDYRGLINFPVSPVKVKSVKLSANNRSLLAWGGGKDSIVAAELLKRDGKDFNLFSLRDSQIQRQTAKLIDMPRIIIDRQIDPGLFKLNQHGAYNGHIPITAIYSFTALLAAALYNYKNIIFSNEKSANYGNVKYLGKMINHQYSKTFEFEKDLSSYIHKFITPEIKYFSLLRPWSELKIVEVFSSYKKYFKVFSSCNKNFTINKKAAKRWCGVCAKCAYAFSQMAAFLPKRELVKMFGKNLYADKKLLNLYLELAGEKNFKPFDCVGTPEEVKLAMYLTWQKHEFKNDYIIKYFAAKILPKIKNPELLNKDILDVNGENNLPAEFKKVINNKFIIIGYGAEGKFALDYLKAKYPGCEIAVADQNKVKVSKGIKLYSGIDYLKNIADYDVIIRSPSVPPDLKEFKQRYVTSLVKLFFKACQGKIIGVTGTKGKSTTASLIYKILKQAGKDAYLVGNIGENPFKFLGRDGGKNKIFVYELSSYQLADLDKSPDVAVFINTFPDHLPWHGSYKNYQLAKANINKYQKANDYFIYNSDYGFIKNLAAESKAKTVDYLKQCRLKAGRIYYNGEKIIAVKKIKLLGRHNLENIFACVCAAKALKIKNRDIEKAVSGFKNLEHRLELARVFKAVSYYDDAISTTPESTMAAIEVFKDKIGTIILGGLDRGYDFNKLAQTIFKYRIKSIVIFPDSGAKIWQAIEKNYQHKAILPKKLKTKDMAAAVKFAYKNCANGQVCLLSTASPSYSIFKNYIEKGDLFKAEVKKLK